MDNVTREAYKKLQKRERLLRVARNHMAEGRITWEAFKKQEAAIVSNYRLTSEEQQAYELHCRITDQRKGKRK